MGFLFVSHGAQLLWGSYLCSMGPNYCGVPTCVPWGPTTVWFLLVSHGAQLLWGSYLCPMGPNYCGFLTCVPWAPTTVWFLLVSHGAQLLWVSYLCPMGPNYCRVPTCVPWGLNWHLLIWLCLNNPIISLSFIIHDVNTPTCCMYICLQHLSVGLNNRKCAVLPSQMTQFQDLLFYPKSKVHLLFIFQEVT